ncbi:MAG: YbhB/YbcL family Raf kinase inhibitor-like protein [Halobacteriales archaeon]|nr:YbhB/YbcL family Raf kinase inhibitor-like protein [Halobacteriales archaeon]
MGTVLSGDLEQKGDLSLTSPEFDNGERMPDSAGYANDNRSPRLEIDGVPDGAVTLVLVMDDPDAQPVAGHTWVHWLVWDIDASVEEFPDGWDGEDATVGYNDFLEQGYGGPSPPEGTGEHRYRFKLLALDGALGVPEFTRVDRLGSVIAMNAQVLASTELDGLYAPEQGTAF